MASSHPSLLGAGTPGQFRRPKLAGAHVELPPDELSKLAMAKADFLRDAVADLGWHALLESGEVAYADYLASSEWRARREACMARDDHTCRSCRAPATEVHHLHYRRIGCEHPDDLVALCRSCHERADHTRDPDGPAFRISPGGPRRGRGRSRVNLLG